MVITKVLVVGGDGPRSFASVAIVIVAPACPARASSWRRKSRADDQAAERVAGQRDGHDPVVMRIGTCRAMELSRAASPVSSLQWRWELDAGLQL